MERTTPRSLAAVVFPGFETLDLFGPVQMFGTAPDHFDIFTVAERSGLTSSRHGQKITADHTFANDHTYDLLLIPGGPGTWDQICNADLLEWLHRAANRAEIVMTVCTGTAFLAKTGLLEGKAATTNKMNFEWVSQFGPATKWQGKARWVEDGKFFTSSGVSAGMDMSLAVIEHLLGPDEATRVAMHVEYERQTDPSNDPFALHYGVA
jgi:transcriptional regulator GlxA family with amidase domain